MFRKVRSRLTYANVMATIAVFLALGVSSSYAVSKIDGSQIIDHSILGEDIKDNTITGSTIRDSTIKTADVADRSLLAKDFKAGQLPQGPQGPKGDQGHAGTNGTNGADATKLFAWVPSFGTPGFHGSGVTGVTHTASSGTYNVTFNRDLTNCVVVATEGDGNPSATSNLTQAGVIATADLNSGAPTTVTVTLINNGASYTDRSFHLAVFC
jgi:hypothetical protein